MTHDTTTSDDEYAPLQERHDPRAECAQMLLAYREGIMGRTEYEQARERLLGDSEVQG